MSFDESEVTAETNAGIISADAVTSKITARYPRIGRPEMAGAKDAAAAAAPMNNAIHKSRIR